MNPGSYQPFTYQPWSQSFFMGRPLPQEIAAKAAEIPEAAAHLQSVWQFSTWLRASFPAMADVIMNTRPDLLDAGAVVTSGKIAAGSDVHSSDGKLKGLSAVGDTGVDEVGWNPAAPLPDAPATSAVTEWGKSISDLLGKYMAYDQQRKLIDLNIKRAEQGLPPVDSSAYGVGVNVGLSPQVQKLAMFAVGGLVLAGVLGAFTRGR